MTPPSTKKHRLVTGSFHGQDPTEVVFPGFGGLGAHPERNISIFSRDQRSKDTFLPTSRQDFSGNQGIYGNILGLETLILGCFGPAEGFQHLEEVTIFLWAKKIFLAQFGRILGGEPLPESSFQAL